MSAHPTNATLPEETLASDETPCELTLRETRALRGGGEHDGYWRLVRYDIKLNAARLKSLVKHRKLKIVGNMTKEVMVDRLHRHDQGLLYYETCSTDELSHFLRRRKLESPPMGQRTRSDFDEQVIISMLCEADRTQTFIHLYALPSEVRVLIYEHYCAHFGYEALCAPTQPPLARVSRQVRQEVLSVFYSNGIFGIHITYPLPRCRLAPMTATFFNALHPEYLAQIRKLQIYICSQQDPYIEDMQHVPVAVDIEIVPGGMGYRLHVDQNVSEVLEVAMEERDLDNDDEEDEVDLSQLAQQMIEQATRPVVDRITGRANNKNKLCLSDIYRFGWVLQEIWERARQSPYMLTNDDM
ncbi:hypothetical protein LTR95_009600 [Oleoguttula sp. CCFEE 5521]